MNVRRSSLASLASASLLVGLAHFTACATGSSNDTGSGAAGPSTSGVGGAGGQGGAGGEGGMVDPLPCGIDCSTIKTPNCQVAMCNADTKQCEVVDADDGAQCDDGKFCTDFDYCKKGECIPGPPNKCGMKPAGCQEIVCDEAAQKCSAQLQSDGTECTDPDNLCTVGGTCQNGVCVGKTNDCYFAALPNECHVAVCNPKTGKCDPTPGNDGANCKDSSDLCTVGKTCSAGMCVGGEPKDCSKLSAGCSLGVCNTQNGQCTTKALANNDACDDLDACTTGEVCQLGQNQCVSSMVTSMCKDGDDCCPAACNGKNDADCRAELDLASDVSCLLRGDGALLCWGLNTYGQLGNGTKTTSTVPAFALTKNVRDVAVGTSHACAVLDDGTVKCWGYNAYGQLGDGTKVSATTPVTVTNLTGVDRIVAGDYFTCALLSGGTAKCWGRNVYGQLGDGTTVDNSLPVAVQGLSTAKELAASGSHACAVLTDGTAQCWGYNTYGQLGNNTKVNSSKPVAVTGLTGVTSIATGALSTCATLSTGEVQCWGRNLYGQLGNGTTTDSLTPVSVSNVTNAVAIGAGTSHACAALADGAMKCWGYNAYGQLGNNTKINSSTAVTSIGVTSARSVDCGAYHTCALSRGALRCWGRNLNGQLGIGSLDDALAPTVVTGW